MPGFYGDDTQRKQVSEAIEIIKHRIRFLELEIQNRDIELNKLRKLNQRWEMAVGMDLETAEEMAKAEDDYRQSKDKK